MIKKILQVAGTPHLMFYAAPANCCVTLIRGWRSRVPLCVPRCQLLSGPGWYGCSARTADAVATPVVGFSKFLCPLGSAVPRTSWASGETLQGGWRRRIAQKSQCTEIQSVTVGLTAQNPILTRLSVPLQCLVTTFLAIRMHKYAVLSFGLNHMDII